MSDISPFTGIGSLASLAIIAVALWKSGVLGALASKMKGGENGYGTRIKDLESLFKGFETFKNNAEDNHFHDLENLKNDVRGIWEAINVIRNDLGGIRERLARLETRVFNGHEK